LALVLVFGFGSGLWPLVFGFGLVSAVLGLPQGRQEVRVKFSTADFKSHFSLAG
jgi:hypothetical protein